MPTFKGALNNGRSCQKSYQCKSMNCNTQLGVCEGLKAGEQCHSHEDCDKQLFCERSASWPFTYECSKLRTSYEQCSESYQCSIAHYCWYASAVDRSEGVKKCLPLYSQDHETKFGWYSETSNPTFDDHKINGQYCKSGIAFRD